MSAETSLVISCIGFEDLRHHTEYVFRVRHIGGCEWSVQRRYQDLLSLHERLSAVFGAEALPEFPPKTEASPAGVIGKLLGAAPGSRRDVVVHRVAAFQEYFDHLCSRDDFLRTACFQVAIAVVTPEPVAHLRVQSWPQVSLDAPSGACALLEVRPEGQTLESCAIVDGYHVATKLVRRDSSGNEELSPISELRSSAVGTEGVRIEKLPRGQQVEIEVCAANAVGRSSPVSIRLMVPLRPCALPEESSAAFEMETASPSSQCGSWSLGSSAPLQEFLQERQEDLAIQTESMQCHREELLALQAEQSAANVVEQRQRHDLQVLQETLSRQREELEEQRQKQRVDALESMAQCARRVEEAQASQAEACAQQQQLDRQREEQSVVEARAMVECVKFVEEAQAQQSEAFMQRKELEQQREQQRTDAMHAMEECNRRAEEAEEQQADAKAQQEQLAQRVAELRVLQQEHALGLERHEVDRALQEDLRARQEDLAHKTEELQRHRQDMQTLQAEHSAASLAERRRREEMQELQASLTKQREDLEREKEEQLEREEKAMMECTSRAEQASGLQAEARRQQEELERQRSEQAAEAASLHQQVEARAARALEQQEDAQRQLEELERQREEQREVVARGVVESEAHRAQEELARRIAEMHQLQREQSLAIEKAEAERRRTEDLLSLKNELHQEREEIRQQKKQHGVAAQRLQEEHAEATARCQSSEEQQEQLAQQRLEVETNLAEQQAERERRLEELNAQQVDLDMRRQEANRRRQDEERMSAEQLKEVQLREAALRSRIESLATAEETILKERVSLQASRTSLAMVQAHTMSMLDRASPRSTMNHQMTTFGLDEIDAGDPQESPTADGGADVWSMDWTSPTLTTRGSASSDSATSQKTVP